MASSGLRHLILSRTSSVFKHRHFTTSRSLSRPVSIAKVNGAYDRSLTLKLQIGVRYFSSSDPTSHTVPEMPALSPTINQGNIAKWKKKEGDKIEVGDMLCEIETDKATVEFESLEEGFLSKIPTPEGSEYFSVGQPIHVQAEDCTDSITSPRLRAIPKVVVNQICQVVNSYPKGIHISELLSELERINGSMDKDFFGYYSFSRLLECFPAVLKLQTGPDKQTMVHGMRQNRDKADSR